MSDSAYQVFQHYGTNAQRLAFTPNPPTSPTGTQPLYIWFETDTSNTYAYTTGWHLISTSGGLTPPGGSDKYIQYNNSGAFGGIVPGSAGTVLTSNGASSTASFQAAGSGGALVLLEQHTASSSATLDFTTFISSTYDTYQFELLNVRPATDATDLRMRVATSGPSWDSSANYLWGYFASNSNAGNAAFGPGSSTFIQIQNSNSNGSTSGTSGTVKLYGPQSSVTKFFTFTTGAISSASVVNQTAGSGAWSPAGFAAAVGVQFYYSSGNIASGTIRCYGLAK